MQISVYNQEGKEVSALEVSEAVFGVKENKTVIHQAAVAQSANSRSPIAHTKTRGDVSGGGKKPWKQKGTGQARHGSIRSPIWRGGGVTFGPRSNRNFTKKITSKMRRSAILMALSDKFSEKSIIVLESFQPKQAKTKEAANILKALPLKRGKIMLALPKDDKAAGRLAVNIKKVTPMWVGSLNVVDLLKNANLVTTVQGIKEIEKIYGVSR